MATWQHLLTFTGDGCLSQDRNGIDLNVWIMNAVFDVLFQSLLHDPNPNSPANNEAAQLYRENRREYEKKVAAIVQASWNDDD